MQEVFQLIRTELRGSWRYRWPAVATAWLLCLIGWFVILTLPDIYEARAQVYVDADSRLAEVVGDVGVAPGVSSRVFVVRQAMLGRPQLERVARDTDLDLRARTPREKEALIDSLRETIGVASGRSREAANLYTITYEDRERGTAVAVVQTLLDTFVEDVLKLKERGSEQVSEYLDEQLAYYSELLTESESALATFKKQYVGLLPGENGGIFERVQAEMGNQKTLRAQLQIEEERRNELRRQLRSDSPYLPEGAETTTGSGTPGSRTEAIIGQLEARRASLLLSYTERHPDVVATNEQLEQLYQKRDSDRSAQSNEDGGIEGVANATNPVYQSVQIALNESGVRIAGLRSQVQQSEAVTLRLNEEVDTIPEVEAKYSELTRNYDQYKSLYDELLLKRERERLGSVGEERDVVSFNIIDPPAVSFEPVAPQRVFLLVVVLIVGLAGGAAVAFIIHQLNPIFHDAKSLRDVSGYPVLGVVSMTWLERHKFGRQLNLSSFAAATVSLVAVFLVSVFFRDQLVDWIRMFVWQATG